MFFKKCQKLTSAKADITQYSIRAAIQLYVYTLANLTADGTENHTNIERPILNHHLR